MNKQTKGDSGERRPMGSSAISSPCLPALYSNLMLF
jgi:hypothetical protein